MSPQEQLEYLDKKAKAFFQEKLHANKEMHYTEMIKRLEKS